MDGAIAAAPAVAADVVRTTGAAIYTDVVHAGLWCIAVVSVLGAVAVGLLARERVAEPEPVVLDKAEV